MAVASVDTLDLIVCSQAYVIFGEDSWSSSTWAISSFSLGIPVSMPCQLKSSGPRFRPMKPARSGSVSHPMIRYSSLDISLLLSPVVVKV